MSRHWCSSRWTAMLVCGVALITVLGVLGASATAATHLRPAGSRSAHARCFTPAQSSEPITGSNLAFLRRLVPCEARALRPADVRTLPISRRLSRDVAEILAAERRVPTTHFDATLYQRIEAIDLRFCRRAGTVYSVTRFADSQPPPPLTPASIVRYLGASRRVEAFKRAGTVFGIAYERRALNDNEPVSNPVAFGLIGVNCP